MNLPNLLTLLRIFFVPLLVATLLADDLGARWQGMIPAARDLFALAIFLAAAATDLLDGYLARRWGQVTTVGTLLDPIADKLLISAALISLVDIHRVPAWIVIVIIGREFAVTGLRSIAAASGYTIRASDLGKTKMIAQVAAISLVIAGKPLAATGSVGLAGDVGGDAVRRWFPPRTISASSGAEWTTGSSSGAAASCSRWSAPNSGWPGRSGESARAARCCRKPRG